MHPIEHQLTAYYGITHGHGLAIIAPRYLQYVRNEKTLPRIVEYGVNVWGIDPSLPDDQIADEAIARTAAFLYKDLELVDNLAELGVREEDIPLMAKSACKNSVIQGFIDLNQDDIEAIYRACMTPFNAS